MKKLRLLGIVFALLAVPAEIWASQVTHNVVSWGRDWTPNSSNGPLETSAADFDTLSFNWTFDTISPDSDPSSDWGFYSNAITDCNLSIGAYSFACGSGPNHIELGFESSFSFDQYGNEYGVERYIASATLADAFGFSDISFQFHTFFHGMPRGTLLPNVDSLVMQPWNPGADTFYSVNYTYQGQMYTGHAVEFGGAVWTVVPIPPAVWLFGSGLLGLIGIARRK